MEELLGASSHLENIYMESCRRITDATLLSLVDGCPRLAGLDVGGCYNLTSDSLSKLLSTHQNKNNFSQLHLSGSIAITDRFVRVIGMNCPNLVGLSIGYGKELSDAAVASMLQRLPNLESLQLHWNHKLSDELLVKLATICPNLMELNIIGCVGFTDEVC